MKKSLPRITAPYRGEDLELRRDAGGAYWEARDGILVRVAAPEPGRKAKEAAAPAALGSLALALRSLLRLSSGRA